MIIAHRPPSSAMRVPILAHATPARSHVGKPSATGDTTITSPHVGLACRNGTLTSRTRRLPLGPGAGPRSCAHGVSLSCPWLVRHTLIGSLAMGGILSISAAARVLRAHLLD